MALHLQKPGPWLLRVRSSESFIVLVVAVAMFTDTLSYTMIIPIIPSAIVSRAGVPQQDAQFWVSILLAAYGAGLLLGSPLFGYFSDRFASRKLPFTLGLAALCASTILFALASSPATFVLARALQGLSCAAVWVIGLVVIVDNIPQERIGEAMGQTTAGMTMGGLLGPVLGGLLYDSLGYYGVFVLPTALIILDITLRFAMIERSIAKQWLEISPAEGEDTEQNASSTFSDTSHSDRDEDDEQSPLLASRPPGVVGNDKKAGVLSLLRSPRLLTTLASAIIACLTITSLETTLPIFIVETFHWSPSRVGLIFLVFSLPTLLGAIAGKLVDIFGARRLGSASFAVIGVVFFSLRFIHHNTATEKVLLGILLAIMEFGILMVTIIAMTEVFQVIDEHEAQSPGIFGDKSPMAQAYGLFNMAYATGQLLGPILAGYFRVQMGWAGMTLFFGIVSAVFAVPMGLWSGQDVVQEG